MFGDESAFYLLPAIVRTWAKKGHTPILHTTTRREHLSVASAISLNGQLVSRTQSATFKGAGVVAFLKHLLRQISDSGQDRAYLGRGQDSSLSGR